MADGTDALFAALEEEGDFAHYRAQRLQQLQSELSSEQKQQLKQHQQQSQSTALTTTPTTTTTITTLVNNSSSALPTLPNDQSVLDFTTQTPLCILHFFHPDFARCASMNKHLTTLALAHGSGTTTSSGRSSAGGTPRFARVDVRNIPFVVEKLKIKVLPCVLAFREGVVVERVVGFEGLGVEGGTGGGGDAADKMTTGLLEDRLVRCGVLGSRKVGRRDGGDSDHEEVEDDDEGIWKRRGLRSGGGGLRGRKRNDDDDDDDWD